MVKLHVHTMRSSWLASADVVYMCCNVAGLSDKCQHTAPARLLLRLLQAHPAGCTTTPKESQSQRLPAQLPIHQGSCSGSQTGRAASGDVQHHRLSAAMTARWPQTRPQLPWGLPLPTQFQPCSHIWLQRPLSSTQQRPWPLRPRLAPRRRDKIHRCSIPWQQRMLHSGHRVSNSPGTLR